MPIDDYPGDAPDASPNVATTPGKYIKITVDDFTNTKGVANPGPLPPTPLTSYLRLGAVEDVAKAGKVSGTVGLVTDMAGNPLQADAYAPFNPSYDPYLPFGPNNLPSEGNTPLPPTTTPGFAYGPPPAPGPDPTGEDLASLVQGFADDTRNRGRSPMRLDGPGSYTPGGQPEDPETTAQGPMYGYPWVTPVPGAKAPGTLDAGDPPGTKDAAFSSSSKPVFFADDYRTLESSQLHTKGGWRDHTDGNRITTTRGDKIEVIRGNYKLIVLGRQDQTKPKYAGMDLSGGQATTAGSDLGADASTDFNQGSTAYSSLFEWRQCTSHDLFQKTTSALFNPWQGQAQQDQQAAADAQLALDQATSLAKTAVDGPGYMQNAVNAAMNAVKAATTTEQTVQSMAALSTAKSALAKAEAAYDPRLLEEPALVALAATAPQALTSADANAAMTAAVAQASAMWAAVDTSAAKAADAAYAASPSWATAYADAQAWNAVVKAASPSDPWATLTTQTAGGKMTTSAAAQAANLSLTSPPGVHLATVAAAAWANAAYSTAQAEAWAISQGLFSSPLDTLALWEDNGGPTDFRSFATTKKGSGPRVQVKFQRDPQGKYLQDGRSGVPGDGVTYATPVAMGVLINETWSHQIYNYTGMGYYPATAPQPWPPPRPKTQTALDGTSLPTPEQGSIDGTPLPTPDRSAECPPWGPVPQWVIYPVSKVVNKAHVVHQSSEVFAGRIVALTAGLRPSPDDLQAAPIDPAEPYRTYPPDVPQWLDTGGKPQKAYSDTAGKPHTLPAKATYDRDLLTDEDTQFPTPDQLAAWILSAPTDLPIRDYAKLDQRWTETHVKKQATILRADTTLSDTKVGDQYAKLHAGTVTVNNTVDGLQHTIVHAGNTTTETTVDGVRSTTLHATSIDSTTVAHDTTSMSAVTGGILSMTYATSAMALKAILVDVELSLKAVHMGVDLAVSANFHVGPRFSKSVLDVYTHLSKTDISMLHTVLDGAKMDTTAGVHVQLAAQHTIG